METSKAKTISKPKKTSVTSKSEPSEAEIRDKAKEIYHQRVARGEHGTPLDDWLKAEKLLKRAKEK